MSKPKILSPLSGLVFFLAANAATAFEGTLKVGTEGEAPPFSMADANGMVTGFDADVANALCDKLHVKCVFSVQAFDILVPAIDTKRFDVIVSALTITEERRKKIGFSLPYAATPQYFIVPKGSPLVPLKTLGEIKAALAGKVVGVVNGTTYSRFIAKNIPSADLKTYDSLDQLKSDLVARRLDAAFDDAPSVADFMKSPESADFARLDVKVMATDDPATLGQGMGVGLRKTDVDLKQKIDAALCEIIRSGDMKAISEKWFQDDYSLPCAP